LHSATWYLTSTTHNLDPTAIHNSSPVPVEMAGCEEMQFKQCAVIRVLDWRNNYSHQHSSPHASSVWEYGTLYLPLYTCAT